MRGGEGRLGNRVDVRLAGAGGQGVVLAGVVLAQAAILSGLNATQSQSYGPESRGGASCSDVAIARGEIGYPKAEQLDVLVALTQEACDRYARELRPSGVLLVDERLVGEPPVGEWSVYALPLLETARGVSGGALGLNMVALGALVELTRLVDERALEQAVIARVPGRHRELNLRALAAGRQLVARLGQDGRWQWMGRALLDGTGGGREGGLPPQDGGPGGSEGFGARSDGREAEATGDGGGARRDSGT